MMKKLLSIVLLVLAACILAAPAAASLIPMSWGFPQMTQDHTLTAFQKDTASATDSEAASVAFPTAASIVNSAFGTSFPTISQTADKTQVLDSVRFQNENQHFAFSYPFLSIGGSPIPSMGFL